MKIYIYTLPEYNHLCPLCRNQRENVVETYMGRITVIKRYIKNSKVSPYIKKLVENYDKAKKVDSLYNKENLKFKKTKTKNGVAVKDILINYRKMLLKNGH